MYIGVPKCFFNTLLVLQFILHVVQRLVTRSDLSKTSSAKRHYLLEHAYLKTLAYNSFYLCLFFSRTDVDAVVEEIARKEALITASKTEQVRKLIGRILFVTVPKI